jgi:hypothetical protein
MINRKKAAKAGLVAGPGALAAEPVIATAKAARDSSCYRDDYIISRSSDYYWRRWRLPQQNRLLQRRLLLQQRLRRAAQSRLLSVGDALVFSTGHALAVGRFGWDRVLNAAVTLCARRFERHGDEVSA